MSPGKDEEFQRDNFAVRKMQQPRRKPPRLFSSVMRDWVASRAASTPYIYAFGVILWTLRSTLIGKVKISVGHIPVLILPQFAVVNRHEVPRSTWVHLWSK